MLHRRPLLLLSLALLAACGGQGNYVKSVNGTKGGYSMKNVTATPPSLMVAKKIDRPLFIVLDATKVKDTVHLKTSACATGADTSGCEQFDLMDVQTFVRRDLKAAMENYFSRVEVVESTAALPSTPHIVGDVKIDKIALNSLQRGMYTYVLIEMTWGFAMRPSDATDYTYSFAGTATSDDSYPTFEAGCGQMVEHAIPGMLKKWTESGGVEAMRDGKKD